MSEEKNVPNIRFKEFTDPWEQRKLGSTYEITMGQSPNSNNYTKNPNDFILVQGNADIKNGRVVPRMWTKQITKLANPGDIILSVRAPVGDVGITNYTVVLGRGVASISGDDFIYQTLVKMKTFGFWRKFSTGSTFESINSKDIKNAVILVPIANERRNIGTIFKSVDATIALHQQKVTQLKELKKLLMQKIFDQEWRFKGFTDPWEQRKLGNVGEVHSGVGFPEIEQGGTEGIAFYKVSDMNIVGNESVMKKAHNYVNTEQIEKRNWKIIKHVPAIIFAKVGAAIMLNRKRIVQSPFLIDNNIMTYIFDKSWDVFFGKTLFDTINLPKYAQTGALPSYNTSDIKNIKVLIPNKNLQTKIGALFKKIDITIALHQQKVDQLKELKKYLMQNLFV